MPIVLIGVCDVAEGELVQSGLATSTIRIDIEKNDPSEDGPDKADEAEHSEVSYEEIVIQGLMVESKVIGKLAKGRDPVEHAERRLRCLLSTRR